MSNIKRANLAFPKSHSTKALEALVPEAKEGMNRVKVDISYEPPMIEIEAEDTSALRAALNSYLRWLNISEEITTEYGKC